MTPTWSILICTTICRRKMFLLLLEELRRQATGKPVEILYEEDAKTISVGRKRQNLLERSRGTYISYFDSDDWPMDNYVDEILAALAVRPDCVGMLIYMTTNNVKPQVCCHSLKYPEWKSNVDGYDYVRGATHFNPIKREHAIKVGFQDKRFGEDKIYSDAVTKLCVTEVFIPEKLFHYRYTTHEPHAKKYGFKR